MQKIRGCARIMTNYKTCMPKCRNGYSGEWSQVISVLRQKHNLGTKTKVAKLNTQHATILPAKIGACWVSFPLLSSAHTKEDDFSFWDKPSRQTELLITADFDDEETC